MFLRFCRIFRIIQLHTTKVERAKNLVKLSNEIILDVIPDFFWPHCALVFLALALIINSRPPTVIETQRKESKVHP